MYIAPKNILSNNCIYIIWNFLIRTGNTYKNILKQSQQVEYNKIVVHEMFNVITSLEYLVSNWKGWYIVKRWIFVSHPWYFHPWMYKCGGLAPYGLSHPSRSLENSYAKSTTTRCSSIYQDLVDELKLCIKDDDLINNLQFFTLKTFFFFQHINLARRTILASKK